MARSTSIPISFVTDLPVAGLLYLYLLSPSMALMMRLLGALDGPLSISSGLPTLCKSLVSFSQRDLHFGYILTMIGQRTLRPTVVSVYNYVQPVVSVAATLLMGIGILKPTHALAVILVFSG